MPRETNGTNGSLSVFITQKSSKTIANKLNIPFYLLIEPKYLKKLEPVMVILKRNIDSYLISRNYNPPKQVDDILILI